MYSFYIYVYVYKKKTNPTLPIICETMNDFNRHAFLFVCAALALSAPCLANFHEDKWELRPVRWHVHVVNNLGAGKTLFAHCQSKNDDIGNRTIAPGAEITWSFKPNFFGTTLYWCYTRMDHEHTAFDVYWEESKHNWLRYRCNYKECFWIAKDDGFYIRVIPEKRDELIHKWEPGW